MDSEMSLRLMFIKSNSFSIFTMQLLSTLFVYRDFKLLFQMPGY